MAPSATTTSTTATNTLTAENVLRLVPEVDTNLASSHRTDESHADLAGYDEEQIRLMDEVCIVLDEDDKPIGSASKKVCHLMSNIDKGLLHRAFSVFLFDASNRLLLQQRADSKITFPSMWTNTCCSHPLGVPTETGADLPASVQGVRHAARRKLEHELGIPPSQVPLHEFRFLTRIHYKAPSDGKWGEHEIDYILMIRPTAKVTLVPNDNEVRDVRWVDQETLRGMFKDAELGKLTLTPWFRLICESMLFGWWDRLEKGTLDEVTDEQQIRRML